MITFADRKGGFPHSEMSGSKGARASPDLIAACHVLHRLSTPRHPSEALMRLIVLSKTHAWLCTDPPLGKRNGATHALCICQTMMSSQVRPASAVKPQGEVWSAGLTLPSRCHPPERQKPTGNSFSSIASSGGARRDRTDDLMLAKHPLYQLSYGPLPRAAQESSRPIRGGWRW